MPFGDNAPPKSGAAASVGQVAKRGDTKSLASGARGSQAAQSVGNSDATASSTRGDAASGGAGGPASAGDAPKRHARVLPWKVAAAKPKFNEEAAAMVAYSSEDVDSMLCSCGGLVAGGRRLLPRAVVVGCDIEWRVTYKAGEAPRRTAVIQIAPFAFDVAATPENSPPQEGPPAPTGGWCRLCRLTAERDKRGRRLVLLFHVFHMGLPDALRSLLEDSSVRKVGVGIRGDVHKLKRDFGVTVKGVLCLTALANTRLRAERSSWSLADLCREVLGVHLDKGERLTNWETRPLHDDQVQYAARDALVSLRVYAQLVTMDVVRPLAPPSKGCGRGAEWVDGPITECVVPLAPKNPEDSFLSPTTQEAYRLWHDGRQTVAQVAQQRGIQYSTALSYILDAVSKGLGYRWSGFGVPDSVQSDVQAALRAATAATTAATPAQAARESVPAQPQCSKAAALKRAAENRAAALQRLRAKRMKLAGDGVAALPRADAASSKNVSDAQLSTAEQAAAAGAPSTAGGVPALRDVCAHSKLGVDTTTVRIVLTHLRRTGALR